MPSLDGYSLNEKMDKKFEDIEEEIEMLKSKVEKELTAFRATFTELNDYLSSMKDIKKNKESKDAKSKSVRKD